MTGGIKEAGSWRCGTPVFQQTKNDPVETTPPIGKIAETWKPIKCTKRIARLPCCLLASRASSVNCR
eukprot:4485015-Amphidinium_carterae.1